MSLAKNQAACLNFGQIGWKYYNSIRKKAVEQEFSWPGLFISLSIAFFIVITSAYILNFVNRSIIAGEKNKNIYYLEKTVQVNLMNYHNINITYCG